MIDAFICDGRRACYTNRLDAWFNFVQIIVLGVGALTVQDTTPDKESSAVLVVFVTSVAVLGPLLALFKLVQTVTNNLKFDIFLSILDVMVVVQPVLCKSYW